MKKVFSALSLGALVGLSSFLPACSDDSSDPAASGAGTAAFTTWGEEYIEQEIPPTADGETIVEDGYTIKYSRFLVAISEITISNQSGTNAAKQTGTVVFDMHEAGVKEVARFPNLSAKAWDRVSYALVAPGADATLGAGATEDDKRVLVDAKAGVHVEGTISKGNVSKSFAWTFPTQTLFKECKGEVAGKEEEGVVVTNGGTDTVQLTIHGDHLFYDDLQSLSAKVRCQAMVDADKDDDDVVTLDELAAVKLSDAAKATGGTYGAGDVPNVNNLKDFVTSLTRTIGHYRGEGECFASPKLAGRREGARMPTPSPLVSAPSPRAARSGRTLAISLRGSAKLSQLAG